MAHEIPSSTEFSGLSRKVLEYSEAFQRVIEQVKAGDAGDDVWTPMEELVDTENFVRQGVFLTDQTETIDWATYKTYISKFGGAAQWEATLRHLTEGPRRVVQELEERNLKDGVVHAANTVMAYGFDDQDRVNTLEVYVMNLDGPQA